MKKTKGLIKNSKETLNVDKNKILREQFIKFGLISLPIIVFIISLTIGGYYIPVTKVFKIIGDKILKNGNMSHETMDTVIFKVRLPRVMLAMVVGAALSTSGATYQGMFKNPLVSPDILGASAGAAFGASLGILLSFGIVGIQFLSFGFGIFAVIITYLISMKISRNNSTTLILILGGMLVGTLFSSFISLIKYIGDPYEKLPAITFWLMGSLASSNFQDFNIVCITTILSLIPLMLVRWKLNVMSFGDEEARALGINTNKLRILVILCSTLMTASAVSVSGLIGWVGLIVPHFVRMLVGPNYKKMLPASILVGSTYLLLVDDLARSMCSIEIPLGILTSLIGIPFFIYLMINVRKGWA